MTAVARPWIYPTRKVGDIVWWFPHGVRNKETKPLLAAVTKVNDFSCDLSFIRPYMQNMDGAMGVKHLDDPNRKEPESLRNGAWCETDRELELRALTKTVTIMEERLTELEAAKEAKTKKAS